MALTVTRLAQAHVLDSRVDGGQLLVRPAVISVAGRISEELLP